MTGAIAMVDGGLARDSLASPAVRAERLREGFSVVIAEEGGMAAAVETGGALALSCPLGPGRDALVRLVQTRGPLDPSPEGGGVSVVIDVGLLQHILNVDYERLPSRVAGLGAGGVAFPRTADLLLAAHAIRGCRHQGAIRNLFLKSKALEMLALAFGILRVERPANLGDTLSARNMRAVMRARDLLLERLDDPPRLGELASVAGMCETRLKASFKMLFGDTPASLARRARMAAAREMLVQQRCQVSEAASAVGYTNVSHFIDAFVREFGIRPGNLVKLAGLSGRPGSGQGEQDR